MQDYFSELEQESIRDNFVLIYELLDEICDFGYPQITNSRILKEYIMNESHKLVQDVLPPDSVTNVVGWRPTGIKHKRNEVFLDVIEKLNLLISSNGTVLHSEILGVLFMRSYLSGMPELKLGLNDKVMFDQENRNPKGRTVEMDDVRFHQCVQLSKFESDRTISFIPPDGEFELMSYRLDSKVRPLFDVQAQRQAHSRSRIEYSVKIRANYKRKTVANFVHVEVPVPPDADSPQFKCGYGSVEYVPEKDLFVWKLKQVPGKKEYSMRAEFGLPSISNADSSEQSSRPIHLQFEIPYFTVSGIQVRYLKVTEKSGYQALPWVRYITQNGDYQIRMPW
jgi:AP-1 complex subunit mu